MILLKTALKRLLAMALVTFLVCALFYGCNKEPELPPESETESEPTTEDPWATEEEETEEEETEEETEPPTTTRRPTTTTKKPSTTSTTTTTTTGGSTTIPDGSDKVTTTSTTKASVTTPSTYSKVTGVKFNGASGYTLAVNNTQSLNWTISPANATNKGVVFFTSNASVATVTAGGVVTAKGTGTCTITVKTTDPQADANYEDSITITVPVVLVTGISISGGASVGTGSSLQLSANVLPANATNKDVTWSLNCASSVATINSSGLITAHQTGAIVVTATAKDGSGKSDSRTIQITT